MNMNLLSKTLPTLLLLLLAVSTFVGVVTSYDPIGLLGWLFCLAIGLTAGNPAPSAEPYLA